MKFFKMIGIVIIGIIVLLGGAKLLTANASGDIAGVVDQFNPLVKESSMYVITTEPQSVDRNGYASYKQKGVTADGKIRTITFDGLHELKLNRYLKLSHKGAHVNSYEEVQKEEVPEKVYQELVKLQEQQEHD